MSAGNLDVEEALDKLPDEVATALSKWRIATLARETKEALLYCKYKGEDKERSATEIKALININQDRYNYVMEEIKAEAIYKQLEERLMAMKKRASLRTAY